MIVECHIGIVISRGHIPFLCGEDDLDNYEDAHTIEVVEGEGPTAPEALEDALRRWNEAMQFVQDDDKNSPSDKEFFSLARRVFEDGSPTFSWGMGDAVDARIRISEQDADFHTRWEAQFFSKDAADWFFCDDAESQRAVLERLGQGFP